LDILKTRRAKPVTVVGRAISVVGLLTVAVFINYIDRGNLATAAPLLKHELHLTNTEFGLVTSAFFWAYTPGQLVAAWFVERINAYRALAAGFALWSIATALTGLANGLVSLIALRVLLGLGEASASPSGSKLLADHLPPARFGLAGGVLGAGIALGPSAGTLLGGLVMAWFGWRMLFALFGLAALAWLVPWLAVARHAEAQGAQALVKTRSYREIIAQRALWGCVLGHLMANFALYFLLAWLPLYLVSARGFTLVEMATIGGLVYAIYGISAIAVGAFADTLIASGTSLSVVRKATIAIGHVGLGICLAGAAFANRDASVVWLLVAGVFCGCIASSLLAITQTLAGPGAAAKWTGLQNMLANLAGIAGPVLVGYLVDVSGSFVLAFLFAGAAAMIGALGWTLVTPKVEPILWDASVA
jgi:MFS family permease